MAFDAQAVFASLAEKERIKGHHSPEGRAIRTLSRALSGWSHRSLSRLDAIVLCDQAIEDWLKSRLRRSAWSEQSNLELVPLALASGLIARNEADRLLRLRGSRAHVAGVAAADVEAALEFCIGLIDKHW